MSMVIENYNTAQEIRRDDSSSPIPLPKSDIQKQLAHLQKQYNLKDRAGSRGANNLSVDRAVSHSHLFSDRISERKSPALNSVQPKYLA